MKLIVQFVLVVLALLASAANAHIGRRSYQNRHRRLVNAANASSNPDPEQKADGVEERSLIRRDFPNARATWYDVGLGACGQTNVPSDYIVALTATQFGNGYPGPYCFNSITISYNGRQATAQIMDECMGCPYGGIDMSLGLFSFFADPGAGVLSVDWWFNDNAGNSPAAPATTTSQYVAPTTTAPAWTPDVAQPVSTINPPSIILSTPTTTSSSSSTPTTTSTMSEITSVASSSTVSSTTTTTSNSTGIRSANTTAMTTTSTLASTATASISNTVSVLLNLQVAFVKLGAGAASIIA